MNDVTYRNATPGDATEMQSLWRQFWSEQSYEENLVSKITADPQLVIVAEANGKIVGTVIGGWDGWWPWIYRLAVSKAHQRRGIGTELLRLIHTRLQARGADAACAIVNPDNAPMYSLLQKLGYTEKKQRLLTFPMKRER
jgi:ribosomal protein S18 acetylase RimI-like enzyme